MRWIAFILLACGIVLVQATLGGLLTLAFPAGPVRADLVAAAAVFTAMYTRSATDAMLGGWILGLAVDLTTAGGPWGSPVVGLFAVIYSLLGGAVFRIREAFFRDRALTQAIVTALFCLVGHWCWITAQSLRLGGWEFYGSTLVQAAAIAGFTGVLAPLMHLLLAWGAKWIFPPLSSRGR